MALSYGEGLSCPLCGASTRVVETRRGAAKYTGWQQYLRRRRECMSALCGRRFSTQEVIVDGTKGVPLPERVTLRIQRPTVRNVVRKAVA